MKVIIFAVVFTNFAATLVRQPSAASIAPRLNNLKTDFKNKNNKPEINFQSLDHEKKGLTH